MSDDEGKRILRELVMVLLDKLGGEAAITNEDLNRVLDGSRKLDMDVHEDSSVLALRPIGDEEPKTQAVPYVGFENATLEKLPPLIAGDDLDCPHCGGTHAAEAGGDPDTGGTSEMLLFYHCGQTMYLAGVAGKNVTDARADISGEASL